MSTAKTTKVFKISFRNKSEADPQSGDDGSRVAFVEGTSSAAARARLLSFVVDLENIERASPTDLAYALSGVMRGEQVSRKPIVLLEQHDGAAETTRGHEQGAHSDEPVIRAPFDDTEFQPRSMIGEDY